MEWGYFLPCLWAFLACGGFCIIFNVRTGIHFCCIGGALGWLVYLLTGLAGLDDLLCHFLAAVVIALYSEIMARVRKCPVTGYVLISLFPLVPGAGIYYTMLYTMQGQSLLAARTGLHTLGIAGCLALGVLVVSSTVRMTTGYRKNRGNR